MLKKLTRSQAATMSRSVNKNFVLRRDVEERGGLVADRGAAAGEVGEGADGDEGCVVLVSEEGHDGALHLHEVPSGCVLLRSIKRLTCTSPSGRKMVDR